MPRGKVVVSAASIREIEKKLDALDVQRAELVASLEAMRTLLGMGGQKPSGRAVEKPAEVGNVPKAFLTAMDSATGGLTPREIREAVLGLGVKQAQLGATGNYLYSVIARALKRGDVVKRGARYYRNRTKGTVIEMPTVEIAR